MKKIIIPLAIVVSSLGLYVAMDSHEKDQTWEVLLKHYPSVIKPAMASNIKGFYILKQTHEPYFVKNERGLYSSNILESWKRSSDSTTYSLCPKVNLTFSNGVKFDSQFIKEHIEKISNRLWELNSIYVVDGCANINFKKSTRTVLAQLSKYQQAPSVTINDVWDAGLGFYDIESYSDLEINMVKKIKSNSSFNRIIVKNTYDVSRDQLHKVEDYNFSRNEFPEEVKQNYSSYSIKSLRSYNLILNIKNKSVREKIYNCLNILKFRKNYVKGDMEFINIKNIMPLGLNGSQSGLPTQRCTDSKVIDSKVYTFINWKPKAQQGLEEFFKDFYVKTGVEVVVEPIGNRSFAGLMFKKKHDYHIIVMAIETAFVLYEEFFELFTDPTMSIIDRPLKQLNSEVRLLGDESNKFDFNNRLQMLLSKLESSKYSLPLFQPKFNAYFPERVKSVQLNVQSLKYPKVGELRL